MNYFAPESSFFPPEWDEDENECNPAWCDSCRGECKINQKGDDDEH